MRDSFEVVLDTGPLVAWLNESDQHHAWCAEIFQHLELPLVTTESVIAEAAHHLMGYKGSADALCEIIESGGWILEPVAELDAVCRFMRRYQTDFADASVVWLSERHPRARVFTIDFAHFRVYRRFRNQSVPLFEPPARL